MNTLMAKLVDIISPIYPMAKRWLHRFNGGVYPSYFKQLSADKPVHDLIIPDRLVIPLQQQVGQKAELLVKIGDKVLKNQLIANSSKDAAKALVVPIHAPTSGTVIAIESHPLPHPSGLTDEAIILAPDFKHQSIDNALQVDGGLPKTPDELKELILKAGIIGMGGAGYPTYAKIPSDQNRVKMVLINGAECEPFISCDDLLMQTKAQQIIEGALITAQALGTPKIICGIESNKPKALEAMRQAALKAAESKRYSHTVEVVEVESVYPMGGQEQLIYQLTGIEIPHNLHAIQVNLLMMNVATFAAIYQAIHLGEPLTSRLVTITGLELQQAFNIEALIGTPFDRLITAAQPKTPINFPAIMGGPMMGYRVADNSVPVSKTTNCILVNRPEPKQLQMPCIRCGECMDACPVNLLPQQMYWHAQAHEFDKAEKLNIANCIECGCCSYVCPSNIPLVQYYRHAKAEIRQLNEEAQAAEIAKQRHEFRQQRLEREQKEREERLKAKKAAVKQQALDKASANQSESSKKTATSKQSAAQLVAKKAAAARAAARTKNQKTDNTENSDTEESNPPSATDNQQTETKTAIPAARLRAIEAAKKAAANANKSKSEKPPNKETAKQAAKQAAMAAAKKRQAKQTASDNLAENSAEANKPPVDKSSHPDSQTASDRKKQAAMAATKRAAQLKAKKRAEQAKTKLNKSDGQTNQSAAKGNSNDK